MSVCFVTIFLPLLLLLLFSVAYSSDLKTETYIYCGAHPSYSASLLLPPLRDVVLVFFFFECVVSWRYISCVASSCASSIASRSDSYRCRMSYRILNKIKFKAKHAARLCVRTVTDILMEITFVEVSTGRSFPNEDKNEYRTRNLRRYRIFQSDKI